MLTSEITHIIFDMDGVIINTEPLHYEGHRQAFEAYGMALSLDSYEKHIRSRGRRIGYHNVLGDVQDFLINEIGRYKDKVYRALIADADVVYEDALNLIKTCFKKRIPMAIGTASNDGNFVVDVLNIRQYFQTVITGQDVSHNKPNPEIYLKCMKALNAKPESTLIIEDSLAGVEAAVMAGGKVVYIQRDQEMIASFWRNHEKVTHMTSLEALVEEVKNR